MKKAAIYARVSTNEGRQNLENQIITCTAFLMGRITGNEPPDMDGHPLGEPIVYTDEDSGAKTDKHRPGLRDLLAAAARREFSVLVVFALSRLTREGPARAFDYIQQLHQQGVEFISVTEPQFRTSGPAGELLIAMAAYFAKEERRAIQARVQAGVNRARAAGKILGRPVEQVDPARLLRLKKDGLSVRQIARALECSKSTIERRLKTL